MPGIKIDASLARPLPALQWTCGRSKTNGIELAWEQAGPDAGKPLLMVMGLSWQLIHWPEDFCSALVDAGFRLIRFDNRDSGLSSDANRGVRFNVPRTVVQRKLGISVPSNYTLHDMANDTLGLMDALGLERAHLLGVSMGGMISQIMAGTAPQRVMSLCSIMSSTNHPWLPAARWEVTRAMFFNKPKDQLRETMVEREVAMMKLIGSPMYPTPDRQLRSLAERAFDRAFRPGGILRQTHGLVATGSFQSLLSKVTAPTQVIHGVADPLVRLAGGRRTAKLIRGAHLEMIDGMGHDLPAALRPRLVQLIVSNAQRA